jgi:nitroreductase
MDYSRLSMPVGEAIFTQRSIRRFRPDPISLTDVRLILAAAVRAPNGGNQQIARFLVLNDRATIREFGALYHEACGRSAATMRGSWRTQRIRGWPLPLRRARRVGRPPRTGLVAIPASPRVIRWPYRERRRQATHPARVRPELVTRRPLVVWSWDITKLKGPRRGCGDGPLGCRLLLVWPLCNPVTDQIDRLLDLVRLETRFRVHRQGPSEARREIPLQFPPTRSAFRPS